MKIYKYGATIWRSLSLSPFSLSLTFHLKKKKLLLLLHTQAAASFHIHLYSATFIIAFERHWFVPMVMVCCPEPRPPACHHLSPSTRSLLVALLCAGAATTKIEFM